MNDAIPSAGRLAVVLKGWPRLSETFIAQELVALENRGLRFEVWSMRHPTDKKRHVLHDALKAKIHYLPEYLYEEPLRVLKGLASSVRLPGFGAALGLWLKHLVRDPTPNRVRRFGQAAVLAREASPDLKFIYAHFLHTPSSVALYASIMRGVEWGFSAHAKDIWKSPDWEKRDKLERSTFGVTCTRLGAEHLRSLSTDPAKLDLVYHGLDLSRFPSPPPPRPPRNGSGEAVTIISVGRLVEKKGYNLLLDALGGLPAALKWRFIHIGGGDLSQQLKERAQKLGLSGQIEWRGSTRSERGDRCPARSGHLRAAFTHRQRRRPRRAAECPDGGREPGAPHPVDQRLVHSGIHRKRQARRPRRARCRSSSPQRSRK